MLIFRLFCPNFGENVAFFTWFFSDFSNFYYFNPNFWKFPLMLLLGQIVKLRSDPRKSEPQTFGWRIQLKHPGGITVLGLTVSFLIHFLRFLLRIELFGAFFLQDPDDTSDSITRIPSVINFYALSPLCIRLGLPNWLKV